LVLFLPLYIQNHCIRYQELLHARYTLSRTGLELLIDFARPAYNIIRIH
jgi:hypothetical protein